MHWADSIHYGDTAVFLNVTPKKLCCIATDEWMARIFQEEKQILFLLAFPTNLWLSSDASIGASPASGGPEERRVLCKSLQVNTHKTLETDKLSQKLSNSTEFYVKMPQIVLNLWLA